MVAEWDSFSVDYYYYYYSKRVRSTQVLTVSEKFGYDAFFAKIGSSGLYIHIILYINFWDKIMVLFIHHRRRQCPAQDSKLAYPHRYHHHHFGLRQ